MNKLRELSGVDLIFVNCNKMPPIEVKSSSSSRAHASLDHFMEKFGGNRAIGPAYVVHTKDLSVEGDVVYIPVYMVHAMAEPIESSIDPDAWGKLLEDSRIESGTMGRGNTIS